MGGEKPGSVDDQASTVAHVADVARESHPDLKVDDMIGRYRLVSRIGAGAMGVVWAANDPQLDRKVAIKLVHPKLARSQEASNRLLREARAMAKLSHHAVVTVHDAGEVGDRLFLAMELVEGTSLGQMLRTRTEAERRDYKKWLDMMIAAGRGLEAAHGAGVLHRDFKPDNVLVDEKGRVCVADFGLAALGEELPQALGERISKSRLLELTTTGALLGTPAYMSPQQLRGEPIDARADQFSFCVATYEALYGRRPFSTGGDGLDIGDMLAVLQASIEHGDIEPAPDALVPDEIFRALYRGLAANPEDRWPTMGQLLNVLERHGRATRRNATSPSIIEASRPRLVVGGIAVAVLAILAVVVVLWLRREEEAPAPATARELFDVPLKTRLGVTADGKRLVLVSDRIEVREVEGTRVWVSALAGSEDVAHLEITNDTVMFGLRGGSGLQRWHYQTEQQFERVSDESGAWVGETKRGHLYYRGSAGSPIQLIVDKRVVRELPVEHTAELVAISPNKQRVAILDAERFTGTIVIRDVTNNSELRSGILDNPTALTWQDDRTLVYATGTIDNPTIFRLPVTATAFGAPEKIYTIDKGWFGDVVVGGGRMFFVEMGPKSRGRLVDRETQFTRELDAATVGAAFAWTADDEFLAWNRTTERIERRTIAGKLDITEIRLDGEPANATLAGDTLIATVRESAGREVVAYALATGTRLWSHPAPVLLAVRCADDHHAPCFGLRRATGKEQLVKVDPQTGAIDDAVLFEGMIEDLAVNDAGDRIVLAMRAGPMREISAGDGRELAQHDSPFTTVRSVAFDRGGGFLIAGTLVRNMFQVGRYLDGRFTLIAAAENDLLSLVRPSPDGKLVLVHARIYAPVLWELPLP